MALRWRLLGIPQSPKIQLISLNLHDTKITYSVQISAHNNRGSVVLIDGWSQSKCSTLRAAQNRVQFSGPLIAACPHVRHGE